MAFKKAFSCKKVNTGEITFMNRVVNLFEHPDKVKEGPQLVTNEFYDMRRKIKPNDELFMEKFGAKIAWITFDNVLEVNQAYNFCLSRMLYHKLMHS